MLGTALIVFREIFEASLIVSIVAAATRGLSSRLRWIGGGILAGILGAMLVAGFADVIANFASGVGQEIFNASVLFAAAGMITWHVLWMSSHGKAMAKDLGSVSAAVKSGARPPSALLFVVAIAILREGSEIVLFMYGLAAGGSSMTTLIAGSALGLIAGIAAGTALYFGLLRIPPGKMFSATNWLLILVAAGMASQGAHFLIQADLIPALGSQLWNTSALVANGSMAGQTLHALIGYDARPTGMQILFFIVVVAGIGLTMSLQRKSALPKKTSGSPKAVTSPQPG